MFLLDTNALSEFVRRRPNAALLSRARGVPSAQLWTSAICVMELRYGAMRRDDSARFWPRLEREVLARVSVAAFGEAEARRAGDVLATLEAMGCPIGVPDAQIAATALEGALTVVTANTRHFERVPGLSVEDWTSEPPSARGE